MKTESADPLVSICCMTYNQEHYIRDAIEGFLMQITSFPIEIIVHDDASTDGTTMIVREYEKKYPELIHAIIQTENQYSKGIFPAQRFVWPIARGKYIALCEGDDFWTDRNKLQMQVDFLESHEDYGMIHTDVDYLTQKGYKISPHYCRDMGLEHIENTKIFDSILLSEYQIFTPTVLIRKAITEFYIKENNPVFKVNDSPLWLETAKVSKIKFVNKVTATYRKLEESASHSNSLAKAESFWLSCLEMRTHFVKKFDVKGEELNRINDYIHMNIFIIGFRHANFEMSKIYWKKISADYLKKRLAGKYLIFLLAMRNRVLFHLLSRLYRLALRLR